MRRSLFGAASLRFRVNPRSFLSHVPRSNLTAQRRYKQPSSHPILGFEDSIKDNQNNPISTDTSADDNDNLLTRASKYGIQSIDELDRQSQFLNQKDASQLVQNEPFRSDFELWQLLLDYQAQNHGSKGLLSIYRLLKYEGSLVRLSSDNKAASALWKQMLVLAARDRTSYEPLNLLCERNGVAWCRPKLFSEVIAALLEAGKVNKALGMCQKLRDKCRNKLGAVLDILRDFRPANTADFARLFIIYLNLQPLKIYEKAMEELWQQDRNEEAVLLHKLLISHGDVPTSIQPVEVLVAYLARTNQDPKPILDQLSAAGIDYSHKASLLYEAVQQESSAKKAKNPTTESGQTHTTSNRVSDTFAARAFASNALPFEFVLNSLKVFGLTEVGPQTIREIGLVAKDLSTLKHRLKMLRDRGIDTGASSYVRTVRRLCQKGEAVLLAEILNTDIHHDVFEDTHLQWHLIAEHAKNCNWSKVNLLLTVLSHGNIVSQAAGAAKVALLSKPNHTDNNHRAFLNFALQIHGPHMPSGMAGLNAVIKQMILEMRSQSLNRWTSYQQLQWARFVAGLMQEAVLLGQSFEVFEWRHVISRIGGRGMPDLAIGLIYWVVRLQHGAVAGLEELVPIRAGTVTDMKIFPTRRLLDLGVVMPVNIESGSVDQATLARRLVDLKLQQALVHWSLQHSLLEKWRQPRETWQDCLQLLRLLEQKYHIPVDLAALQSIIIMRCRYLQPKRHGSKSHLSGKHDRDKNNEENKAAWRECSRLISEMHDLWSVPSEKRSVALDKAFEQLFATKAKSFRPHGHRRTAFDVDDLEYDYL